MHGVWFAAVVDILGAIQSPQDGADWKSVIRDLIDAQYTNVAKEQRERFAAEMNALLDRHRVRLTAEKFGSLVDGMKQWGFWTRASTSALDHKSADVPHFPEYPSSFIDREFSLLIEYHDAWITTLGYRPDTPRPPVEETLRQYESLLAETRLRLARAVVGPYSDQYVDTLVSSTLKQMQNAGRDSSWMSMSNLMRPLTEVEVAELLQEVDRRKDKLVDPVRADVPPLGMQGAAITLDQRGDHEKNQAIKRVWDVLHGLVGPLDFAAMKRYWAPEVHAVDKKIDALRSDVGVWWRDSFDKQAAAVLEATLKNGESTVPPVGKTKRTGEKSQPPVEPSRLDLPKGKESEVAGKVSAPGNSWSMRIIFLILALALVVASVIVVRRKSAAPTR